MTTDPDWLARKDDYPVGATVECEVIRVMDFGVFVRIPGCPLRAVLLVTEFEDGDRSFDRCDYPAIGEHFRAVVVDHADHSRQLRLSCRASLLG